MSGAMNWHSYSSRPSWQSCLCKCRRKKKFKKHTDCIYNIVLSLTKLLWRCSFIGLGTEKYWAIFRTNKCTLELRAIFNPRTFLTAWEVTQRCCYSNDDFKCRLYSFNIYVSRDVNVHKINSFLRPDFQFVSISKRNVIIYSWLVVNERRIKHISCKKFLLQTFKKRNTNILQKC
jgi:hypothetical protein